MGHMIGMRPARPVRPVDTDTLVPAWWHIEERVKQQLAQLTDHLGPYEAARQMFGAPR